MLDQAYTTKYEVTKDEEQKGENYNHFWTADEK